MRKTHLPAGYLKKESSWPDCTLEKTSASEESGWACSSLKCFFSEQSSTTFTPTLPLLLYGRYTHMHLFHRQGGRQKPCIMTQIMLNLFHMLSSDAFGDNVHWMQIVSSNYSPDFVLQGVHIAQGFSCHISHTTWLSHNPVDLQASSCRAAALCWQKLTAES